MAGGLNPGLILAALPLLWLCGWSNAAVAQLADPTRPALSPAQAADAPADPAAAAGGLQSVILRKGGRPAALINGEVVELGGKLGEARLVKIGEDAVVLRGPAGEETLRLTPAAEKKAVKVGSGNTVKKAQRAEK